MWLKCGFSKWHDGFYSMIANTNIYLIFYLILNIDYPSHFDLFILNWTEDSLKRESGNKVHYGNIQASKVTWNEVSSTFLVQILELWNLYAFIEVHWNGKKGKLCTKNWSQNRCFAWIIWLWFDLSKQNIKWTFDQVEI